MIRQGVKRQMFESAQGVVGQRSFGLLALSGQGAPVGVEQFALMIHSATRATAGRGGPPTNRNHNTWLSQTQASPDQPGLVAQYSRRPSALRKTMS